MDQMKQRLSFYEFILILGYAGQLLLGLLSVFIGVVTFFAVNKWFGLITFLGGLILFPFVKKILKTKHKPRMSDLLINSIAVLLIIFGLVSSVEQKRERGGVSPYDVDITEQKASVENDHNNASLHAHKQNSLLSKVYDVKNNNEVVMHNAFIVNTDLACRNQLDMSKLVDLLQIQNDKAYSELAYQSLKEGHCIVIKKGDIVRLQDVDLLLGMVQLQKQDSPEEYWTLYGNVKSET